MLRRLHKSLTSKFNQDIVTIANALFAQQGFDIHEKFVATNKANFQCEVRTLDFANTDGAAASINSWVKNHTKGEIPHKPWSELTLNSWN